MAEQNTCKSEVIHGHQALMNPVSLVSQPILYRVANEWDECAEKDGKSGIY